MLTAMPKSWWSSDFVLEKGPGRALGSVRLSPWRPNRGSVVVDGTRYKIHRKGWRGAFLLALDDGAVVSAFLVWLALLSDDSANGAALGGGAFLASGG